MGATPSFESSRSYDRQMGIAEIHRACRARDRRRILHLLDRSPADINLKTRGGKTPLNLACSVYVGSIPVVKLLIQAGASLSTADRSGRTPLHNACVASLPPLVWLLVDAGAPIASRDKHGKTPLHVAATRGSLTKCFFLLEAGAPLTALDDYGHSPLDAARWRGTKDVIKLLEEETARRSAVWRGAPLQRRCWVAAARAHLDVDARLPPVVIRQNRRWQKRHRWTLIEEDLPSLHLPRPRSPRPSRPAPAGLPPAH